MFEVSVLKSQKKTRSVLGPRTGLRVKRGHGCTAFPTMTVLTCRPPRCPRELCRVHPALCSCLDALWGSPSFSPHLGDKTASSRGSGGVSDPMRALEPRGTGSPSSPWAGMVLGRSAEKDTCRYSLLPSGSRASGEPSTLDSGNARRCPSARGSWTALSAGVCGPPRCRLSVWHCSPGCGGSGESVPGRQCTGTSRRSRRSRPPRQDGFS